MTTTNHKHGYFVCDPGDDGLGFAVVARSADEAKEAVHEAGWLEHLPKEDMVCSCICVHAFLGRTLRDCQKA